MAPRARIYPSVTLDRRNGSHGLGRGTTAIKQEDIVESESSAMEYQPSALDPGSESTYAAAATVSDAGEGCQCHGSLKGTAVKSKAALPPSTLCVKDNHVRHRRTCEATHAPQHPQASAEPVQDVRPSRATPFSEEYYHYSDGQGQTEDSVMSKVYSAVFFYVMKIFVGKGFSFVLQSVAFRSILVAFPLLFLLPGWLNNHVTGFTQTLAGLPRPISFLVHNLSGTYCHTIGIGCRLPFIPLAVDPRLYYAHSAQVQARHLSHLTDGLALIIHPSRAPLHSDAVAKMSIHIRHGSSSPSKDEASANLDRFRVATQRVEDALFDASGTVAVRVDKIIEGVENLYTMLKDPVQYSDAMVRHAHDQFLLELDAHLAKVALVLADTRQATSFGRATGELAYDSVVKIISDVNDAIMKENKWRWFPGLSGVQREVLLREKDLTEETKNGVQLVWDRISDAERSVKEMRGYISAFRELGAQNLWTERRGLSIQDAIGSLGQFIELAKKDRRGELRVQQLAQHPSNSPSH